MLQRLIEQRKPLVLYAAQHDVTLPSSHQAIKSINNGLLIEKIRIWLQKYTY